MQNHQAHLPVTKRISFHNLLFSKTLKIVCQEWKQREELGESSSSNPYARLSLRHIFHGLQEVFPPSQTLSGKQEVFPLRKQLAHKFIFESSKQGLNPKLVLEKGSQKWIHPIDLFDQDLTMGININLLLLLVSNSPWPMLSPKAFMGLV